MLQVFEPARLPGVGPDLAGERRVTLQERPDVLVEARERLERRDGPRGDEPVVPALVGPGRDAGRGVRVERRVEDGRHRPLDGHGHGVGVIGPAIVPIIGPIAISAATSAAGPTRPEVDDPDHPDPDLPRLLLRHARRAGEDQRPEPALAVEDGRGRVLLDDRPLGLRVDLPRSIASSQPGSEPMPNSGASAASYQSSPETNADARAGATPSRRARSDPSRRRSSSR